jgi:hypothetical protein
MRVISVDSSNLEEALAAIRRGHVFVRFHATFCVHCTRMQKDWTAMTGSLLADKRLPVHALEGEDEVVVVEMESAFMGRLPPALKQRVRAYPMMLELQGGRVMGEHKGARKSADMKSWIITNCAPKPQAPSAPRAPPPRRVAARPVQGRRVAMRFG